MFVGATFRKCLKHGKMVWKNIWADYFCNAGSGEKYIKRAPTTLFDGYGG